MPGQKLVGRLLGRSKVETPSPRVYSGVHNNNMTHFGLDLDIIAVRIYRHIAQRPVLPKTLCILILRTPAGIELTTMLHQHDKLTGISISISILPACPALLTCLSRSEVQGQQ